MSHTSPGEVTVVVGPMFAGKTTHLIATVERLAAAGQRLQVFRPTVDTRAPGNTLTTHAGERLAHAHVETVCGAADALRALHASTSCVVLDEIQFWGEDVVGFIWSLALRGVDVVVAGLEFDSRREPFAITAELLLGADHVVALSSACARCGARAGHTARLNPGGERVAVGGADAYEARCDECW